MRLNSVSSKEMTSLRIIYVIGDLNWLKDVWKLSEKQSKVKLNQTFTPSKNFIFLCVHV